MQQRMTEFSPRLRLSDSKRQDKELNSDMSSSGIIKNYNAKGFGFISVQGSRDVFFHISDVVGNQPRTGDKVSYIEAIEDGKVKATSVVGGTGLRKEEANRNQKGKGKSKGRPAGSKGKHASPGYFSQDGFLELESALSILATLGQIGNHGVCEQPLHASSLFKDWPDDTHVSACESRIDVTGGITVGTYNVLHPFYASKYSEEDGVTLGSDGQAHCNWQARALAIGALLRDGGLDVYLLQEVGLKQILDLRNFMGGEAPPKVTLENGVRGCVIDLGPYDCVHFTHPLRAAQDGVAILLRRERLKLSGQQALPLLGKGVEEAKSGEPYMCAGVAVVEFAPGRHLALASVHMYDKKTLTPEASILSFLSATSLQASFGFTMDAVVWGGDCNRSYGAAPLGFACMRSGMAPTRGVKCIDWIFASEGCGMQRSAKSNRFISSTSCRLLSTGKRASDHLADAVLIELS